MKFIDEAVIEVHAGNGGAGSRHFRREKFVPLGGPDGGNGGNGGSVYLVADRNKRTLLDFKFKPKFSADDGKPGDGSLKDGRGGEDVMIRVPVGTEIFRADSGNLIVDLNKEDTKFKLASGGRGGKGNAFFKSATNRAPDMAQPGTPGEGGSFRLSLKLVADVGLVGFPNAGKSTLISRISAAKPKVADYPFTTLEPNLGVVKTNRGSTFVVADIPGLIPGAAKGKGLGIQFLKHVERTNIIAHLVDPLQLDQSGNPVSIEESIAKTNAELRAYSEELANKPQIIVVTKMDAISDREQLAESVAAIRENGNRIVQISSVSGESIDTLIDSIAERLEI